MNFLSFTTLVNNAASAVQAACSSLINYGPGSLLRAIIEANASIALWMQWLILQVLARTRAATSNGSDLDTWMADYSFLRLPETFATGNVTFARFTATAAATIAPGTQVKTADGSAIFQVVENNTSGLWNVGAGAYVIPSGTVSGVVPAQALTGGVAGNVQAGTVVLIATAIAGIDTVTNESAFTNGLDGETDAAFRARFVLYIASLREGTLAAFQNAIQGVQQGIFYSIVENYDHSGTYDPGLVTIYIDDGTGSPPTSLLDAVRAALNAVRGLGVRIAVFGPTVLNIDVAMTLTTAPGFVHATVATTVQTAITAAINAIPLGAGVAYNSLVGVAFATAGVTNVTLYTLNSSDVDLPGVNGQAVRALFVDVA